MPILSTIEQVTAYSMLLFYSATLAGVYRWRHKGRIRILILVAIGLAVTALLPDLAIISLIMLRAVRGERLVTNYDNLSGALGGGLWLAPTWLPWAFVFAAVCSVVVDWRRAKHISRFEVSALIGSAALVSGLWQARVRIGDALVHEVEANIRFDRSSLEWATVNTPWPIRGLEGQRVNYIGMASVSLHPKLVALDSDGGMYTFEPWVRDGVAQRVRTDVKSAFVRPWGTCFITMQGSASCVAAPDGRADRLPSLEQYALSDVQAMGNSDFDLQYCVVTAALEQRCWRVLDEGYLRDDGIVEREVVGQAMEYFGGYCVLRTSGKVTCSMPIFAHGRRGFGRGSVEGIDYAIQVTAGSDGACALEATGQVRCWGAPVGDGWLYGERPLLIVAQPVEVPESMNQISVSDGLCAVARTGEVFCWPKSPATDAHAKPAKVPGIDDAIRVFAGRTRCVAHARGGLSCWGEQRRFGRVSK